jgi:hypothetical protein
MPSKPPLVRLAIRKVILPLVVLLAVVGVAADGPVSQILGVTQTNDTDSGSGEQWGRAGGRSITFAVGDTSAVATLFWGATQPPSAAFDNNVNPSEVMIFDGSSNLLGGIARWTGSAALPLMNGTSPVKSTRFTLTVTTTGGAPVPLSFAAGGATPGINVKSVGAFTANLLFEALDGATWQPILDYYDVQPTTVGNPPGTSGPVLTSFNRGFYFTTAATGMTLEQHDANITQRLTSLSGQATGIRDDTAFLRIETPNRLQSLQSSVDQVQNGVSSLLQNQGGQIPSDIAKRADVKDAKNELQQLLFILFGLMPCPEPSICGDTATLINDLATQASVDQIKQAVDGLVIQANTQQLNEILTQASVHQLGVALNGLATNASIDEVKQALNTLATHDGVEQIKAQLIELAAAVDAINATIATPSQSLELQVVELTDKDSPKRRRWLLRTSLNGTSVAASLTGLVAISANKKQPSTATQVLSLASTAQLMPGLLEVLFDVPESQSNEMSFQFSVRHTAASASFNAGILIGSVK